jgi:polyisoprenoid-binding protein YceI
MNRPDARRRFLPPAAALAALLALAMPPAAQAALTEWRIDPVHTRVLFEVEHLGLAWSLATVSGPSGRLVFDPDGWEGASVEVELPMARVDFGDATWNEAMQGRRWFDVERHPVARFRSTRVDAVDDTHARVHGELEIAGRRAPVVLDVRRNAVKRNPLTLRRSAGFSASAELARDDFGLDGSPKLIGQAVRVRIEVEALREGRAEAEAGAAEPDAPAGDPSEPPSETPENPHVDPQHE